jgi:hypothetical protein
VLNNLKRITTMTVTIEFAPASPTPHPRPPLSQELKSTQLRSATIQAISRRDTTRSSFASSN